MGILLQSVSTRNLGLVFFLRKNLQLFFAGDRNLFTCFHCNVDHARRTKAVNILFPKTRPPDIVTSTLGANELEVCSVIKNEHVQFLLQSSLIRKNFFMILKLFKNKVKIYPNKTGTHVSACFVS
jgi:hypothetical protein